jgi:hypothetical protein
VAYNYLGLVNDVALRLNETQLTSSNFTTSTGFYSSIKESVNSSVRHINQAHFFWPYNHNVSEDTLTAGVSRYTLPDNAKYVDFGSFRVRRNTTLNIGEGRRLTQVTYSEYLSRYIDQEYETDATRGGVPRNVVRTPDQDYIIVPMPDQAYEIDYEYYVTPVDLELYDDVPTIPEQFRHVIVDGAMYYAYMFRDNLEQAGMSQNKFENGIKQMRTLLVNENVYFRSF